MLAALLRDAGFECELLAAEPERPNLVARLRGDGRGPDPVPARPRGHRPRRCRGVEPRPLGGRRRRRRGLGPRRPRHEGPDRRRGRRGASLARARLAPGARRAEAVVITADEETGGDARRAAGSARSTRTRCAATSSSTRAAARVVRVRAAGASTALCVGEKGVFRFMLRASGARRPRLGPGLGDNALLKLAPLLARAARAAAARADLGGHRVPRGPARRADRGDDRPSSRRALERLRGAIGPRWPRTSPSRCCGSRWRRRRASAGREDQRDPRARRGRSSTAASRPGWARTTRASGSRGPRRAGDSRSSSPSASIGNRSPVESPLTDAIAAGSLRSTPAPRSSRSCCRASPTATGSARPSPEPPSTASSRSASSTSSRPRR